MNRPCGGRWMNARRPTNWRSPQLDWLLRDDPDNVQVRMLKGLTAKRIEDRQASERQPPADQAGNDTTTNGSSAKATYLTDEQRNLLKIYEIDLSSKPKLIVPGATVEKIYADERLRSDAAMAPYQGRTGKARFRTLPGYQQLEILFQLRARSLYEEVQVRSEPAPLREFRTRINPTYVVGHCGRCHAVGKEASPQFFTRKANGEEAAYTNFLILSRMTGGIRDMIDRQTPEDSLLMQYGLPREEATFPHPEVPNFRHYFSGTEDRRYQEMTAWGEDALPPHTAVPDPIHRARHPDPDPGDRRAGRARTRPRTAAGRMSLTECDGSPHRAGPLPQWYSGNFAA
jgi:hypothetical protein